MTEWTVAFHFEVNGMIIYGDTAGSRKKIQFDGYTCFVVMPRDHHDFGAAPYSGNPLRRGAMSWIGSIAPKDEPAIHKWSVNVVCVQVQVESDLAAADLSSDESHDPATVDRLREVFQTASQV